MLSVSVDRLNKHVRVFHCKHVPERKRQTTTIVTSDKYDWKIKNIKKYNYFLF